MRKGLITLMTVAIALAGAQAMAMAPVIGNVPNPIVGSVQSATQAQAYVYPDAFNLDAYVSDDATADTDLKWSYEVVGSSKYLINGVQPINSGSVDPVTPPTGQTINKTVGTGEANPDAAANTITVRNQRLLPLGTTTPGTPGFTGIGDIQTVTLWVSDGTTDSKKDVLFYTHVGSSNYLSQKASWKNEKTQSLSAWDHSWKSDEFAGGYAGFTTTATFSGTGGGMCFNVNQTGENFASIAPQVPYFTLTANTVYRVRAQMNGSQTSGGKTPFWDFIIENFPGSGRPQDSLNLYGFDSFFLDNTGSANAILNSTAGTWISMYWAPIAVRTAQWNTNLFTSTYSAKKDARVRFRVLDTDSSGLVANTKFGLICMQQLVVESVPISMLTTSGSELVNLGAGTGLTKMATPTSGGAGNVSCTSYLGTLVAYNSDGSVTLTPQGAGTGNEVATMIPQTTTNHDPLQPGYVAPASPASVWADLWPIAWNTGELFELQADVKAPTTTDAAHPWDVMWMGMDAATNEINCESYVTANKAIGSPTTTAQTYTFFYWSQTKSGVAANTNLNALRWRVRFGNGGALLFPNGETTNTGAVQVTRINLHKLNLIN